MGRVRTFGKRERYFTKTRSSKKRKIIGLKEDTGIEESNPREELLDEELIGRAIWECLKNGDAEGIVEVVRIYISALNKTRLAKKSEMARSTMYHTLKNRNPTIRTLAKIVHACV